MIGLFSICACANQGGPPGGPRDLTGPQVVETFPDTFAVLTGFDDEIRITFDERISERGVEGTLDGAVTISPESGEVRVRHSNRALRVRMEGGFQPNEVYRVTVQPVVQDLFSNAMVGAFEFIFSTGAEMTPTVLAGSIIDRITGEPVQGARITARVEGAPEVEGSDDLVVPTHVAISDLSGVYAFRYVPPDQYVMSAFVDQNRNREYDDLEPIGIGRAELNPADTVLLDFVLLAPDTTPAVLGQVDLLDSLTLEVEFDDFLDQTSELIGVSASLGPDSLGPPQVSTIMHQRDYVERLRAIRDSSYVADSIQFVEDQERIELLRSAGDSIAADEIEAGLTTPRSPPESSQEDLRTRDLPKRMLYLLLAGALTADQPYELSVAGVTNINDVPGGGGSAEVIRGMPQRE